MSRYIMRRLALVVPSVVGVSILVFLLIRLLPGDVIDVRVGTTMGISPEQLQAMRAYYGLDRPLPVQYLSWIGSLAKGDLGTSIRSGQPVTEEIANAYPVTLELTVAATLLAVGFGVPLGVVAALYRNRSVDLCVRFLALLGLSFPHFWLGTLIILTLSLVFRWMPNTGTFVSFWADPVTNLKQILFPVLTLGAGMGAAIMRQTRSSMLDVLGQDYVRTAYAKGLSRRVVITRHSLKNALIVVITLVGIQIGYLLGGAIVIEEVFALPGLGRMMLNAILQRDYAVVQGVALLIALNFVLINLVADLLYAFMDPRIRYR